MTKRDENLAQTSESPVLSGLNWPPSAVARPDNPWSLVIGAAGTALLGLIVFASLSQNRQAQAQTAAPMANVSTSSQMPSPEPLSAPINPARQPASYSLLPPIIVETPDTRARLHAPAMVVDMGNPDSGPVSGSPPSGSTPMPNSVADARLSGLESFAERVTTTGVETSRATQLTDTALVAPQGTVIPAVMETAINLDLPGFVRAVVSRDVRGFDGSTVLIPRGSHLIGQYRSGTVAGQSRAFIVWSRVLTPAGVSVEIGSPASDRLGRGGLEGDTDTHFFRRFGNAILLSIISTGLDAASGNRGTNNSAAIVIGSQQQATNIASIALQKEIDIPNTITVQQGTPIRVFVARDLDFTNILKKSR